MCELCAGAPRVSRRAFAVAAVAGAGALTAAAPVSAGPRSVRRALAPMPSINPRSAWGADLPPVGPLETEAPGDVRFLLVHHTAGSNDYAQRAVPDTIRSVYRLHTAPEKGWPDVAYNFFVDRYGGIWEARAGSIDAPVKGSATGGSQGFALLCCFLGLHTDVAPTAAAQSSMVSLLAWLADREGVDTSPGATTTFSSRGSNLHPAGTTVTTPTIAGHRDMSSTECPGDAAYALVTGSFPERVRTLRSSATADSSPPTAAPSTSGESVPPSQPPSSTASTPSIAADSSSPPATDPADPSTELAAQDGDTGTGDSFPVAAAGMAAAGATAAGGWLLLRRRSMARARAEWTFDDESDAIGGGST